MLTMLRSCISTGSRRFPVRLFQNWVHAVEWGSPLRSYTSALHSAGRAGTCPAGRKLVVSSFLGLRRSLFSVVWRKRFLDSGKLCLAT